MDQAKLDAIARELLEPPLGEFTERRNLRARELKTAGESEAAAAVQKLRKPPVALWVANQLSRESGVLGSVRDATLAAGKAQASGSPAGFQDALRRLQQALKDVAPAAGKVLEGAGNKGSDDVALRARDLVRRAAMQGGDVWERLASGALLEEPADDLGLGSLPTEVRPAPSRPAPSRRTKREPLDSRLKEARRQAADDARQADEAVERAKLLRKEAHDLAERARKAEHEAAAAEEAAERARQQAAASREAAEALASDAR
jgi:hypothetical protein